MDIEILYEDGEALVIDKPAGLPVDRPRAGGECLEDYLPSLRLGFQRKPLPVHRLDRDTSGSLLLARNPKALKRFVAAFEARTVSKRYLGLVAKEIEGASGTFDMALSKISSAEEGWRMVPDSYGKSAVTHWRKLTVRDGLTMVEFHLETGRTHQIRVHVASGFGAPLLGDPVYGDGSGARRTMLHAAGITMPRAGKRDVSATSPLPADFTAMGFADG